MPCPECEALRFQIAELVSFPLEVEAKLLDVDLTTAQRRILGAMLRRPGAIFSREQLIEASRAGRPNADFPAANVIDQQVHKIRRRIAGTDVQIKTWHGIGFSASIERETR